VFSLTPYRVHVLTPEEAELSRLSEIFCENGGINAAVSHDIWKTFHPSSPSGSFMPPLPAPSHSPVEPSSPLSHSSFADSESGTPAFKLLNFSCRVSPTRNALHLGLERAREARQERMRAYRDSLVTDRRKVKAVRKPTSPILVTSSDSEDSASDSYSDSE
jgi:hypothetical protein